MSNERIVGADDPILAALIAAGQSTLRVQGIEVSSVSLPVRHTVNWRLPNSEFLLGTSRFLSLLAVTFESPIAVPVGEALEIDVELPESNHLLGSGRVQEAIGDDASGWTVTLRFGVSYLCQRPTNPWPIESVSAVAEF